jgi:hypothetical protein
MEIKKKKTIPEKMEERIAEYNEQLKGLLPHGVILCGMAGIFDKFNYDDESYYSDESLKETFHQYLMKYKASNDTKTDRTIYEEVENKIFITKGIDINGDENKDVIMMVVLDNTNRVKCQVEDFEAFIKYPEDYFSSPIVESYLNTKFEREFIKTKQTLIEAHKHTIRNFGFEYSLNNLNQYISKEETGKAAKEILILQSLTLVRDITIDLMYNFSKDVSKSLLYNILNEVEYGFKFSSILSLLDKAKHGVNSKLIISGKVLNSPKNEFDRNKCISVYNLLVNLFSNTIKHSIVQIIAGEETRNYEVKMEEKKNKIILSFTNDKEMENEIIKYLLGKVDLNPSQGSGLKIIKDSLNELGYKIEINTSKNQTITKIIIQ